MDNLEVKSFLDLIAEVRSRGICGACGGCVSFCSAGQLNALRFGEDGLPEFANEQECLKCGICYLVCPQIRALDGELKRKHQWSKPVGQCRELDSVEKLNIKDDIMMSTADGEVLHLPFDLMDDIARPACFACKDFTNEFADISCGGLGSPDGYTTVMVRTDTGEQVYSGAQHKGFIRTMNVRNNEQERLHRTALMAKSVSFTARKQERAAQVLG